MSHMKTLFNGQFTNSNTIKISREICSHEALHNQMTSVQMCGPRAPQAWGQIVN